MVAALRNSLLASALQPRREVAPQLRGQLAVDEVEALRLEVDVAGELPATGLAPSRFRMVPTSGDHLRLPQRTRFTGPQMRGAVRRLLAVDATTATRSRDAVIKEARMRQVLEALRWANEHIDSNTRKPA